VPDLIQELEEARLRTTNAEKTHQDIREELQELRSQVTSFSKSMESQVLDLKLEALGPDNDTSGPYLINTLEPEDDV
jgi:hypothetical protein